MCGVNNGSFLNVGKYHIEPVICLPNTICQSKNNTTSNNTENC